MRQSGSAICSVLLDPFIVLLSKDSTYRSHHDIPFRKDSNNFGVSSDQAIQPLGGVVGPDL